jgi:hypothetical protein
MFANHTFSKEFDKEFISKPYKEFLKKIMGTKFEKITYQEKIYKRQEGIWKDSQCHSS